MKIDQIKSVVGKLHQNLSKEELSQFKNNFNGLLMYLEERKRVFETSVQNEKDAIQQYKDQLYQLNHNNQLSREEKKALIDKQLTYFRNSEHTKYHE